MIYIYQTAPKRLRFCNKQPVLLFFKLVKCLTTTLMVVCSGIKLKTKKENTIETRPVVKYNSKMVYFDNGEKFSGHRKQTGDTYKREPTKFRIGVLPKVPVKVEPKRFHLIISAACPWAHRTLLVRQLKDLSEISVSVVSPHRDDSEGWSFATEQEIKKYGAGLVAPTKDLATGKDFKYLHEVYTLSNSDYTGNITTPVLYDSRNGVIVSNESWDIIRYLDTAFIPGRNASLTYRLYPDDSMKSIDGLSTWAQNGINNAVYKAGMAKSQKAYDEAVNGIFSFLDELENVLSTSRYLHGNSKITVADIQLFPTLVRFDDVYFLLFKCYKRRLSSYYNISNYIRDFYQLPGVAETVDGRQIKDHYYSTFTSANPNKVVPKGTVLPTFSQPHDRKEKFTSAKRTVDNMDATQENQATASEKRAKGEWVRGVSQQRRIITRNGTGDGELPAEKGRYHLYVANNCPWCHRVMLARAVLGLEDIISVDVLFYRRDPKKGWQFLPDDDQLRADEIENRETLFGDNKVARLDSLNGKKYAPEIYKMVGSTEKSVPILFDKKTNTIVNNESAEIIRMFGQGFGKFHREGAPMLYPEPLQSEIDEMNLWIYQGVNNGAYKAGFNDKQEVYEKAFDYYFECLERLEKILAKKRFLLGEHPTEADIRLYPTIVRHDPVYFSRFKLNKAMIIDYPSLNRWFHEMQDLPGVKAGTNIEHAVRGYFGRSGNNLIPISAEGSWY